MKSLFTQIIILQLLPHCLVFSVVTENSDINLIINPLCAAYFGGVVVEHGGELLESLLGFGFHQQLGVLGVRCLISSNQGQGGMGGS